MDFIEECPICLNEYENNRYPIYLLPCKHMFCQECVSCLESKNCPLCRAEFDSTQKNSIILKNFELNFLIKLEQIVNENYENNQDIFDINRENYLKTKEIFDLNFNNLKNEDFRKGIKNVFESKIKEFKSEEIKFYCASLKMSSIKETINERRSSLDFSKTDDIFLIENKYLDDLMHQIELLIQKDTLCESFELYDGKRFYQKCYQEFVQQKFGYLISDLEMNEKLLDDHFKSNKDMFIKNTNLLKEITNKLELKKLPKDVELKKFKELVDNRLRINDLMEKYVTIEANYNNLSREIKSKINIFRNLFELNEDDLLNEKKLVESVLEKVQVFIKNSRIEKLNFKPFETSYLTFLSDYRSNHSHKRFDKYKIINHLLKI
ncbi:unnamed protein product [Brachionus calyciflorus]|uniref:RING-type domain-containing protein n=1 Tax=Brachionus calyciflorus TaxID=104777 RepID=A0A813V3P1_9BILA|nr:unnamed protein product [Brachionus calyciflorus]